MVGEIRKETALSPHGYLNFKSFDLKEASKEGRLASRRCQDTFRYMRAGV